MADRPIIFSVPMVRALMEGRKTQTRRLAERPATVRTSTTVDGVPTGLVVPDHLGGERTSLPSTWRSVRPGDRLWVRETLERANGEALGYPADGTWLPNTTWQWQRRSVPCIHMPRWASRITLTVTDVRVQRLQEINEADAEAEGGLQLRSGRWVTAQGEQYAGKARHSARGWFSQLWDQLHGPGAWDQNPWVVALAFSVARRNIDKKGADHG